MSPPDATLAAIWRIESPRVIARLTRLVGDLALAEELAQEALLAAMQHWPTEGIPGRPGAWLLTTAKRRGIDMLRRSNLAERRRPELEELEARRQHPRWDEDELGDELLRLIFVSCHPVLGLDARVALTLRLLCGLETGELARAMLVSEATMAQRLVRAKRTLAEAKVPFEVPGPGERAERLDAVLEVLYLVFNEGYAASRGDHWMRPALCAEAMRLGRALAALCPAEPEVHGLLALMELQASRMAARVGPGGEPILLLDQDRRRWDRLLIRRGLEGLARAEAMGPPGPYTVQAAIAACHARAQRPEETDWARIAARYALLVQLQPSPVVELNRAVAVGMALGPAAGLAIADALAAEPALQGYHLLPSVRGEFLARLGRREEARAELQRAASLTGNERERTLLLGKAAALDR